MKIFFALGIFLTLSQFMFSQESTSFAIIGEYSENFRWSNYSGGLALEVPLDDKIAINYKITIGGSSDRAFYIHAPAGAAVGSVILSALGGPNNKFFNALGAVLYAIPEGMTFYPNPDSKARVGIYLSPLGVDYWKKRNNYEYFRFSGETGGKLRYALGDGKVDLMVYGGVRYVYNKKGIVEPLFLHAGIGVCFNRD
ncbi:MAG: hypothetical protein IPG89_05385 [Bacteroidetes bacterium]|nr:hypothetical protein [Bacteroidota bacterium]